MIRPVNQIILVSSFDLSDPQLHAFRTLSWIQSETDLLYQRWYLRPTSDFYAFTSASRGVFSDMLLMHVACT